MSDHSELKRLAEAAKSEYPDWYTVEQLSFRAVDEAEYVFAASPAVVLALIAEVEQLRNTTSAAMFESVSAENEALHESCSIMRGEEKKAIQESETLRKKLTTVHFVCDRLPDQDGCRFIELENPQGESLGDESGKWEIRPDGLAQLVVDIASPDVRHLSALLECAQGDLRQAMQIIEKNGKDAERYRYLRTDVTRGGPYDFCIVRKNWGNPALERILTLEDADQEIDAAMSKEG